MDEPVKTTLQTTPTSALEACNCRMPEEVDPNKPSFSPCSIGLISKDWLQEELWFRLWSKRLCRRSWAHGRPWGSGQGVSYQAPCIEMCSLANWGSRRNLCGFKGKGQGKGGKQGSGGMPAQLGSKQGQTSGFRWTRRMTSSGVEVCLFCVYFSTAWSIWSCCFVCYGNFEYPAWR